MKSRWQGVRLPPNTPLPANEFFHVNSFAGGYDSRDAQEDLPPGSSPSMLDMEVSPDDRLIRAPGVTSTETLARIPKQVILHADFKYRSELVLLAAPYIGIKRNSITTWYDVGLRSDVPYGYTNYAGILLLSNGVKGTYFREFGKTTITQIPDAPPALGLTVFAGRVVLGGTLVSGNMDFMGIGWSGPKDYTDWSEDGGAGAQSMIGSMRQADRFQAFAPLGFDTLAIINRRSIWIGTPTGDLFQPITFAPRLEDTGCIAPKTVVPTEYGVIFLSPDGVRIFNGNTAEVISPQINQELLPLDEALDYSASFDPDRKRYYLHTPNETWVCDILRRRWFRWHGVFSASIYFPTQGPNGPTWGQLSGTWGEQIKAWWQFLSTQSGGQMTFLKGANLGHEDPASFGVFGTALTPEWYDHRTVGENQDQLMTALGARFTYECDDSAVVKVALPDKPNGNFEDVEVTTLAAGPRTLRQWVPFIHTGRGISLGLKIVSGSPRIRRASVEFQQTGMLWEGEFQVPSVPEPVPAMSDGIIKAKITAIDGFDAGRDQSVQPLDLGVSAGSNVGRYSFFGAAGDDWDYFDTGGRDDGGYVKSRLGSEPDQGQFNALLRPTANFGNGNTADPSPQSGGMLIALHHFGQVLPKKMGVMSVLAPGFGAAAIPHMILEVNVDRTVSAVTYDVGTRVHATSSILVPDNEWYALEWQYFISPIGNDTGGFVLCKLFTIADPVGQLLFKVVGIKTRNAGFPGTIYGEAYGTQARKAAGAGQGVAGIGIDDVHFYNNQGTARRILGDLRIGAALAAGPGTHTESSVEFVDEFAATYGTPVHTHVHGSVDRWRNVSRRNRDRTLATPLNSPAAWISAPYTLTELGTWIFSAPGTEPNYSGGPTYNRFVGTQKDSYTVEALRSGIYEVVARAPLAMTARYNVSWSDGFGGGGHLNSDGPSGSEIGQAFRPFLITSGLTEYGKITIAAFAITWRPQLGYATYERDLWDSLNTPLSPAIAQATEVGLAGEMANAAGEYPYNEFHAQQVGFEYSYRKQRFLETEPPPVAPAVNFTIESFSSGFVEFTDTTAYWEGTVASRSWNFGDGSPVVTDANPDHQYEQSGSYNVSLTVTGTNGQTATKVQTVDIADVAPIANFSYDGLDLGPITFTDLSITTLSTIVSRLWDFGDGTTSTADSPTHTYAAPGTKTVTLTVTDNHGLSDAVPVDIVVPIVPPVSGCGLSALALTNPATLGVQAEDFNGGYARQPAYASTAAFQSYYFGTPFRSLYRFSLVENAAHIALDSTVLWNGHPTVKVLIASPAYGFVTSRFSDDTTNLGDDANFTNAFTDRAWYRLVFKIDAKTAAVAASLTGTGEGLIIIQPTTSDPWYTLIARNGHIYLELNTRLTAGATRTVQIVDLGLATDLASGDWFEAIMYCGQDFAGAHNATIGVWFGPACSLAGASPKVMQTRPSFPGSGGVDQDIKFRECTFDMIWANAFTVYTPEAQQNIGLFEQYHAFFNLGSNPFGVALS